MALRSFVLALALIVIANGTPVMRRPDDYLTLHNPHAHVIPVHNSTARPMKQPRSRTFVQSHLGKRAGGKISAGYFTNWGIYARNFQPSNIITSTLTHILYAFADVDPTSGAIKLTDSYADEQKHFPTDSWNDVGTNLYGCLKQMYLLKQQNRNLKVLLSIGGWTYSQSGHFSFVTNPTFRSTFVSSAVQMIEDYAFDGIDIDFEYPSDSSQGSGFASLITQLRSAFDQLALSKGDSDPYQLTVAVSAGYANYANLVIPQMDASVTYWNLMAYDYAGSWSTVSDDQSNLYGGTISNVSTDKAVKDYIARGATISKMNMGIPLYGRAFESTSGIRQPYNGIGPGTWEAGVYDYKALPFAGATVIEDVNEVASYSYDSTSKELVSYDTPHIVTLKVQYINAQSMAGSMFWSLDSDKIGGDSLIGTSAGVLGQLDQTQNHLSFPNSKWTNIANGMSGSPPPSSSPPPPSSSSPPPPPPTSSSPPPPPPTTSSPPPPPPTSTSSSPSPTSTTPTSCVGVAPWNSTVAYVGGQSVTYNGHLWTAKWWTEADIPGGAAGVWVDNAPC